MAGARGGRSALATGLAALLVALAGCGDSGGDDSSVGAEAEQTEGVGRVSGGSTAQFADCRAWRKGSVEERYTTIREIRGGTSSELPDEAAYEIFEKTCATDFSDSLRLYKLYDRALAFAPLRPETGE